MRARTLPLRPTPDSLTLVRDLAAELRPEESELSAWHDLYAANHDQRIALDLDLVCDRIDPGARVLECGSVPLLLTGALARRDFEVTGADLAPERYASAIAAHGLDVVRCDLERQPLPFADDSFDAVLFNELFEHLRIDPIFTLSEVRRVLRPGASMFLSTPNLRSFRGLANFLLRNRSYSCCGDVYAEYRKLSELGHMGHVREYTTREVDDFLSRIGFEVRETLFRGGYPHLWSAVAVWLFPSLRPFVTFVATKTRAAGSTDEAVPQAPHGEQVAG